MFGRTTPKMSIQFDEAGQTKAPEGGTAGGAAAGAGAAAATGGNPQGALDQPGRNIQGPFNEQNPAPADLTDEERARIAEQNRLANETVDLIRQYNATRPQDVNSPEYAAWREGFIGRFGYDPSETSNTSIQDIPGITPEQTEAWHKRMEEKYPRQPWMWPHYAGPRRSITKDKAWGYVDPNDLYDWYEKEAKTRGLARLRKTQFMRRFERYSVMGGPQDWNYQNPDFTAFWDALMGIDLSNKSAAR